MKIVRENLRIFRKLKNMTQEDVAKKINVTTAAYSNYEQGRRQPSIEVLRSICEVLECSADEIIGIDN